MTVFNWTCPFCNCKTTITESRFSHNIHNFVHGNKHQGQAVISEVIVCPNPDCKEFTLKVYLRPQNTTQITSTWQLVPATDMKVFPDYIPAPIISDYKEACLIRDLSPKASATLSRRCLQGMIREFWGISKSRLIDEIEAIESKVDPLTWRAIDAVRRIGNIGAHMEKDINLVVDVEPREASLLIELIETLIVDWYITRHEREQRLNEIVTTATQKEDARNGTSITPTS
jgi:hypothetical protein